MLLSPPLLPRVSRPVVHMIENVSTRMRSDEFTWPDGGRAEAGPCVRLLFVVQSHLLSLRFPGPVSLVIWDAVAPASCRQIESAGDLGRPGGRLCCLRALVIRGHPVGYGARTNGLGGGQPVDRSDLARSGHRSLWQETVLPLYADRHAPNPIAWSNLGRIGANAMSHLLCLGTRDNLRHISAFARQKRDSHRVR